VSTGIREIPTDLIENTTALGASRVDLLRNVYLAGVIVWIMASARVAIGLAFQAAIVTEFFGSPHGLGFLIESGLNTFDSAAIYAALILTAVLAFVLDRAVAVISQRASRWLPTGGRA
jgi:NitT/TauT family transport system permease protein